MKKTTLILITLFSFGAISAQTNVQTPDQVYGELFKDVQMSKIFPDGKTFVDCMPKRDPKDIVKDYLAVKKNPAIRFSLELFVKENFELPPAPPTINYIQQEKDVVMHIKNLWGALRREPDKASRLRRKVWWAPEALCSLCHILILFPVAASAKFIIGIHISPCWD
jgi:alpha,alpha-trehalase